MANTSFQDRLLGLRGQALQLVVPLAFIGMLVVIVLPVPPVVMDLLISANLALAAVVLMTTIFVEHPLDFSVFPSLLLGTTLFRLVLNIASTRLIMAADTNSPEEATAVAGTVIQSFAQFVAGSSIVVGTILFAILVVVQFVVITKGATRISEVAARFTLDAMPGKQMAIDADLNAGLIDERAAKQRREQIAQEADFYGAMDGAAKFVRGDAVAGIMITVVNVIGGFAVGILIKGWSFSESLQVFTMLTIGDGLVSQVPAFIIALASGLIVTRSSSRQSLGKELTTQLTRRSAALGVTSGFLALMAFTGLPFVPMLALSGLTGFVAWRLGRQTKVQEKAKAMQAASPDATKTEEEPPPIEQAMAVDALELVVGYGLVKLIDQNQGGDLTRRIASVRRRLATEMGFVMPSCRIRDSMEMDHHGYSIRLRGSEIASGEVFPDYVLAMDGGLAEESLEGTKTREPAFGLEAWWIDPSQRSRAESLNYSVVDPAGVLLTHLTETVKQHADELLSREQTAELVEQLKQTAPRLHEEVFAGEKAVIKVAGVQRVLQNLLRENVPIRDMERIVEAMGEWAGRVKDLDILTEYVRHALRRTICGQYAQTMMDSGDGGFASGFGGTGSTGTSGGKRLFCVTLSPSLEEQVLRYCQRGEDGEPPAMVPPDLSQRVATAIAEALSKLVQAGHTAVVLCSPRIRGQVRQMIGLRVPDVAVLSYSEVVSGVEVESLGVAALANESNQANREPAIAGM